MLCWVSYMVLTNLLYPPACPLCLAESDSNRDIPCKECFSSLSRNNPPICNRCGAVISGAFDALMTCGACRSRPPSFDRALAPWQYEGLACTAVRRFKYNGRWRLGLWLAEEMAEIARISLPIEEISLIIPVPLHWLKERLKGWNPTDFLARTVGQRLEKPVMPRALRRIRWTATQTRLAGPERVRNVSRAFSAQASLVQGKSLLLVDDVLTSGATANACAESLKNAGARHVYILTAARTSLLKLNVRLSS